MKVALRTGGIRLTEARPQDGCDRDVAVPGAALAADPDSGPLEALHPRGIAGSHRPCLTDPASLLVATGHRLVPADEGGVEGLTAAGVRKQEAQVARPQLLVVGPAGLLRHLSHACKVQVCLGPVDGQSGSLDSAAFVWERRFQSSRQASAPSLTCDAEAGAPQHGCRHKFLIEELCSTVASVRVDVRHQGGGWLT